MDASSQIRRNLKREQTLVEFPMVIGAQSYQVARRVHQRDRRGVGKALDCADVTDLDVKRVVAHDALKSQTERRIRSTSQSPDQRVCLILCLSSDRSKRDPVIDFGRVWLVKVAVLAPVTG